MNDNNLMFLESVCMCVVVRMSKNNKYRKYKINKQPNVIERF